MNIEEARAARQDIAEVLTKYATGIDCRDWSLFRTCFTADVHADYGDVGAWDGIDALADFMAESHAGMGYTLHRLSNIAITVHGNTAKARSYVDAVLMAVDCASGVNPVGFYDDELVQTDDGWRIARRKFTGVRFAAL